MELIAIECREIYQNKLLRKMIVFDFCKNQLITAFYNFAKVTLVSEAGQAE